MFTLSAFLGITAVMAAWGPQLLDDGYYYLQVAWNISRGAGSSFDGIHPTNGYHPLWQFMLVPLFWVFSKGAALWAAVALQSLLFCASGILLHRLVRVSGGSGPASAAAAGFWVLNLWLWGKGAMSGMETGLLLFLFALSLLSFIEILRKEGEGWKLGILLALTVAARLDSLALAAAAPAVLAILGRGRSALRSAIPTAGYLAVYFPLNLLLFGGATPVSGYVKSREGLRLLGGLLREGDTAVFGQFLGNVSSLVTLGGRIPLLPALLVVLSGALLVLLAYRKAKEPLRGLILLVAIYGGLTLGFYSLMYPSILGAYTYYWLPLLMGALAAGFAALGLTGKRTRAFILAFSALFLLFFDIVYAADRLGGYSFSVPPGERPDAAGVEFLNSLDGEVLVGSWDAGYVGYNCRHPVVNLDGLVAGYDYQRFLDSSGLEGWIRATGITHLANVDYFSGKRVFIEERMGWVSVFEDTTAMPGAVSLFSLSPSDLEYSARQTRIFFVYAPQVTAEGRYPNRS